MRFQIPRFWRRKKAEVEKVVTPPSKKKPEEEFPGISQRDRKKYVGKHVVIVDGKILAAAKGAERALAMVKGKYSGKKIVLRYVASEKLLLRCKCVGK